MKKKMSGEKRRCRCGSDAFPCIGSSNLLASHEFKGKKIKMDNTMDRGM